MQKYSDKSFVVLGETKAHKDALKELGGKWNANLTLNEQSVKGWIFSLKKEKDVHAYIQAATNDKTSPKVIVMKQVYKLSDTKRTVIEMIDALDDDGLLRVLDFLNEDVKSINV
jgi:hypothetical protein